MGTPSPPSKASIITMMELSRRNLSWGRNESGLHVHGPGSWAQGYSGQHRRLSGLPKEDARRAAHQHSVICLWSQISPWAITEFLLYTMSRDLQTSSCNHQTFMGTWKGGKRRGCSGREDRTRGKRASEPVLRSSHCVESSVTSPQPPLCLLGVCMTQVACGNH